MIYHTIRPLYDKDSRVLVLGSFPSVKSREEGFFYGHKQNRFWKVLSKVFSQNEPQTIEEKKDFLLKNRIAVWDVISSCEIEGSADSSIKSVTPNDLSVILSRCDIKAIFVNGKTAEKYYREYLENSIKRPAVCLPSTSPANATWSVERLVEEWKIVKCFLGE